MGEGEIENDCGCDGDPGEGRGGEGEVHKAEPDAGEAVVGTDGAIEVAVGQQGRGKEADRKNGEGNLEDAEPCVAWCAGEGNPGFAEEEMHEKKDGLNY